MPYNVLRHAPVFTSEVAAAVRGTPLASGAKALICKVDDRFVLIVPPEKDVDPIVVVVNWPAAVVKR